MAEKDRLLQCRRCGGTDDLKDIAMMPGATYCGPCRRIEDKRRERERDRTLTSANGLELRIADLLYGGPSRPDDDELEVIRQVIALVREVAP